MCLFLFIAVTILSTVIIIFLVTSEVFHYLTPKVSEDLFVDTTRSHKLKINLDLYIPTISCACEYIVFCLICLKLSGLLIFLYMCYIDLSLDAMDSAGDQHLHIDHNIFKRRVDLNGDPIDEAFKEIIVTSTTKKENIVS